MRWSFRQTRERPSAARPELDRRALDAPVPTATSLEERVAIGAARVAAADGSPAPTPQVDDRFPEEAGVPEVQAHELSAACVASALQHHGGLLVRDLLDEETVARLRTHLHPASLRIILPVPPDADARQLAEVDALLTGVASAYEASGLMPVVREYLREPPVAAAHRIVVRRVSAEDAGLGWHQDGQFFGICSALSVWSALDDCGDDGPSIGFVPQRVGHVIAAEPGLRSNPEMKQAVDELLDGRPFVEPVLRAGDALLFDELTIHRTGTRTVRAEHRDVMITWFFAPSRFPEGSTPLAF